MSNHPHQAVLGQPADPYPYSHTVPGLPQPHYGQYPAPPHQPYMSRPVRGLPAQQQFPPQHLPRTQPATPGNHPLPRQQFQVQQHQQAEYHHFHQGHPPPHLSYPSNSAFSEPAHVEQGQVANNHPAQVQMAALSGPQPPAQLGTRGLGSARSTYAHTSRQQPQLQPQQQYHPSLGYGHSPALTQPPSSLFNNQAGIAAVHQHQHHHHRQLQQHHLVQNSPPEPERRKRSSTTVLAQKYGLKAPPRSGYVLFLTERRDDVSRETETPLTLPEITKKVAARWRSLDDIKKEEYNTRQRELKAAFEDEVREKMAQEQEEAGDESKALEEAPLQKGMNMTTSTSPSPKFPPATHAAQQQALHVAPSPQSQRGSSSNPQTGKLGSSGSRAPMESAAPHSSPPALATVAPMSKTPQVSASKKSPNGTPHATASAPERNYFSATPLSSVPANSYIPVSDTNDTSLPPTSHSGTVAPSQLQSAHRLPVSAAPSRNITSQYVEESTPVPASLPSTATLAHNLASSSYASSPSQQQLQSSMYSALSSAHNAAPPVMTTHHLGSSPQLQPIHSSTGTPVVNTYAGYTGHPQEPFYAARDTLGPQYDSPSTSFRNGQASAYMQVALPTQPQQQHYQPPHHAPLQQGAPLMVPADYPTSSTTAPRRGKRGARASKPRTKAAKRGGNAFAQHAAQQSNEAYTYAAESATHDQATEGLHPAHASFFTVPSEVDVFTREFNTFHAGREGALQQTLSSIKELKALHSRLASSLQKMDRKISTLSLKSVQLKASCHAKKARVEFLASKLGIAASEGDRSGIASLKTELSDLLDSISTEESAAAKAKAALQRQRLERRRVAAMRSRVTTTIDTASTHNREGTEDQSHSDHSASHVDVDGEEAVRDGSTSDAVSGKQQSEEKRAAELLDDSGNKQVRVEAAKQEESVLKEGGEKDHAETDYVASSSPSHNEDTEGHGVIQEVHATRSTTRRKGNAEGESGED